MPPNTIELPIDKIPEGIKNGKPTFEVPQDSKKYNLFLGLFQQSVILLANVIVGIVLGAVIFYAFQDGLEGFRLSPFLVHIVLCPIGYQLLMTQAIFALAPENGWSAKLNLVQKRRAHWILHTAASILAIFGSFHVIIRKGGNHWDSWHGLFGLVALVFTSLSLINGLTSLYAYELRKFLPGNLSKLTHICFGVFAYSFACFSLICGLNKMEFIAFFHPVVAFCLLIFGMYINLVVIVIPIITFFKKGIAAIKNR